MVIFFGPAGAGKSMQSQLLAAQQGWRWLSMGQMLRDAHDSELSAIMQEGKFVPTTKAIEIVSRALNDAKSAKGIVMDGFPRQLDQAEWLVENFSQNENGQSIDLAIVLEVPRAELEERLKLRGRVDDTEKAINERLRLYSCEVNPILNYFNDRAIKVAYIDGSGTVKQVHDRIKEKLKVCKLA